MNRLAKLTPVTDEERARYLDLYNQGLNDNQIGFACGRSGSHTVFRWRTMAGLPPNIKAGYAYHPKAEFEKGNSTRGAIQMKYIIVFSILIFVLTMWSILDIGKREEPKRK